MSHQPDETFKHRQQYRVFYPCVNIIDHPILVYALVELLYITHIVEGRPLPVVPNIRSYLPEKAVHPPSLDTGRRCLYDSRVQMSFDHSHDRVTPYPLHHRRCLYLSHLGAVLSPELVIPGHSERAITDSPLQYPDNLLFLPLVSFPDVILQVFRNLPERLFHVVTPDNLRDNMMKSVTSHCFLLDSVGRCDFQPVSRLLASYSPTPCDFSAFQPFPAAVAVAPIPRPLTYCIHTGSRRDDYSLRRGFSWPGAPRCSCSSSSKRCSRSHTRGRRSRSRCYSTGPRSALWDRLPCKGTA